MALQVEIRPERSVKKKSSAKRLDLSTLLSAKKPGSADRRFFTEQLSLLLETGESLFGALTTIVEQTDNPKMKELVATVAQDVSEGQTFATALSRHSAVFPSSYVNLIAASEQGGFMHEVLLQLLEMEEKRQKLNDTIVSAATYPVFLIAVSMAVVVFVLVVVFPKFSTMFQSIYDQLPASTRTLMTLSDVMRQNWIVILIGVGVLIAATRQWLRSKSGRATVDKAKLKIPGAREIFTQIYLVQTLQVMSLSLSNGVSVMESLNACKDIVRNSRFRQLIADVEDKVQAGSGVAIGFTESDIPPNLAKHMITTGEQTGNLGKVMGRVAEYYESQLTKKLDTLSKLAEPIMLLIMGVIVGVLVSSLILPIFQLSQSAG